MKIRKLLALVGLASALLLLDAAAASAAIAQSVRQTGRAFRDWSEACEPAAQGREVCFIYQRVAYKGRAVANVTIGFKGGKANPIAVINMPLGAVRLPDGLRLQTDKGVDGWGAFQFCDKRGCHVEMEIEPKLLNAMRAGADGWLTFYDLRRQRIRLPLSLRGFTAGLQSLRR